MVSKYGPREVFAYAGHLLRYSSSMMTAALRTIPAGTYRAQDFLDDDGVTDLPQRISVTIRVRAGRAVVDFTGSSPQCAGSINAVAAITESAVFYVFRCLVEEQVPATSGLMKPIRVIAPPGTIVNAKPPAAVAGGNVETSQRIVDTLLRALARAIPHRIPAASQGTMNNLTLGGMDPRHGEVPFTYYETIAGGAGAGPGSAGRSATHTHMTNSLNTPTEVLEHAYPIRVRRYAIRRGSGGKGKFSGGEGILREIEFLADVQVGVLSDRRKNRPYGLSGGSWGAVGRNTLIIKRRANQIPSKSSFLGPRGAILRVETPGGGGWGLPRRERKELSPEKNTPRRLGRETSW
jgi:N-methylhydantoinase B